MEDTTAAAAAANSPPLKKTTTPSKRGQKRGRGAHEEDDDKARREAAVDACFMLMELEAAAFMEELAIHPNDDDGDGKAAGSPMLDQEDTVAMAAHPSAGPFGFDLNEQPSSEDEEGCLSVVVKDAGSSAATADDGGGGGGGSGSGEVADGGATVRRRRPSSGGFDLDLNKPCPSELPASGGAPEDLAPSPAEDSHAGQDAGERPVELPDGGAPVSSRTTRRRRPRLLDWAFEWANGLVFGPLGFKRSRR